MMADEHPGRGGSYLRDEDGNLVCTREPTADTDQTTDLPAESEPDNEDQLEDLEDGTD